MKILVTGSNGQVGSELRELASQLNGEFVFTDRESLDLLDSELVNKVKSIKPNYIINCGAYTAVDKAEEDVDVCYLVNDQAVSHLANAAREANATLLHISTDYVYHSIKRGPLSEDDPCNPRGQYAKSKYQGELNIVASDITDYIIIRTSWVYSSFGNNFVKTMLRLSDKHKCLNVVNDQIGSPTYAADLAETILKIINKIDSGNVDDPYGTFNYSNEGHISWADFARVIFLKSGKEVEVNEISTSDFGAAAPRPNWSSLSKKKIKSTYGIETQGWTSSLQRCLDKLSAS